MIDDNSDLNNGDDRGWWILPVLVIGGTVVAIIYAVVSK